MRKIIGVLVFCFFIASSANAEIGNTVSHSKEISVDLGKGIKMQMILIPAGEFIMGSPSSEKERDNNEAQHKVRITKPFYLAKYEVTQEQWEAVMGNNPSHFKGARNPVERVSWNDCQNFIEKLNRIVPGDGFRLPTEAEWEYAARAGTTTPFHYGNSLSSNQANFRGNYPYGGASKGPDRGKTLPVGTFSPNSFGLYDIHGNVYEWCSDWYDKNYYNNSPVNDPKGPGSGSEGRVLRGGSWVGYAGFCRSAVRNWTYPDYGDDFFGFRCARTP